MFRSLRVRLGAIFLGFLLLVAGSLATTLVAIDARVDGDTMTRLHLLQLIFFGAALVLLIGGYLITRRMSQRLSALSESARRMAAGALDQAVAVRGDDELAQVAQAFETMRAGAIAAHGDLEARVTQRTRELASAFEVSQEIVAHLDLQRLLHSVTDRARALMRSDAAALCLLDEAGTQLTLVASDGDGAVPPGMRQSVQRVPAAQVVGAGQTTGVEAACSNCGFLRAHSPGHCVAAPLRVGDRILGALCVVRANGAPFDADEARVLTLLANSAAIAIANARLIEAGRLQAERVSASAERERLAAGLHDHLAQTLGLLKLKIDRVSESLAAGRTDYAEAELERMASIVGEAYSQVRAALIGLHEPPPAAGDLPEKLSDCVADFRATSGLSADLIIADPSALALPHLAQTQALLIVREALINVRRHAQAHRACVRVDRAGGEALFAIEDDGLGFVPASIEDNGHLGLAIMRARADRSGGYLTVESAPGTGTKVTAHFALDTSSHGAREAGEDA